MTVPQLQLMRNLCHISVATQKYFGVTFDTTLNFSSHAIMWRMSAQEYGLLFIQQLS